MDAIRAALDAALSHKAAVVANRDVLCAINSDAYMVLLEAVNSAITLLQHVLREIQ